MPTFVVKEATGGLESRDAPVHRLPVKEPGKHTFQKFAGYGHLDVFLGRDSNRDVFPFILDELSKP